MYSLLAKLVGHLKEDIRKHFSVVGGSVVIELTKAEIICKIIKLMLFQVRV